MPLFQTSVLNKYLAEQDKNTIAKQFQIFKNYFLNATIQQNIIASKEEEFQEGFLRELFVKVLGYTINPEPNFNLITELKNEKDSKKADGAIIEGDNVWAVIELKSTKTADLNKIETQAFSYKNNQANCKYVITSNFQKIRFYIDNAIEFVEWDLFRLTESDFTLLYLCLQKENLLKHIPATIKNESVTVEESVTKRLYKEYSQFRRSLFQNIVEQNPQFDKLLLFKKTQKLLDRFLFLFFAEDRMLVPPNSVREILKQWETLKELDAYQPLYERFKLYFGYLNTGHQGKLHEIFAYNGGLFASDDVLENIKVDDAILYNAALSLSNYDYNTEVDVNILGHIFEHSLTEIEELENELTDNNTPTTKTTKRKKDGVFYTPKYITKYIVENTIGTLCKNKKEELQLQEEDYHKLTKKEKKKLFELLQTYKNWLLQVTIVDPACGSGAFLNQALDYLINEHKWIAELEANITGSSIVFDIESSILENNLFGVDINEESVEIAKLSLWLRTARKGRKLNSLNNNIKCGNSLIDDPNVAGDKAFNWQEQFPHIFDRGGFDVVIGNPPYVNSKENVIKENAKQYFLNNYQTSIYQIDLYILFLEKSIKIIAENGYSSLIVPNSWLNNVFLADVRSFFLENTRIKNIVSMEANTFIDANVDTIIISFSKTNTSNLTEIYKCLKGEFLFVNRTNQEIWLKDKIALINVNLDSTNSLILNKVNNNSIPLEQFAEIGRGVGVYHKRVGHTKELIERDPYQSNKKLDNTFLPYIRGRNVQRGFINWNSDSYISYGKWLAEPREPKFFTGKRIVLRQIPSSRLIVSYLDKDFIIDQSVFIARFNDNSKFSPKSIVSILGSKLFSFYFRYSHSEFDEIFPKVKLQHFKTFPIAKKLSQMDIELETISENHIIQIELFQQANNQFQQLLKSKFEHININTKLEKWYELSFSDFNKELTKQKVKLSLSEQSEWLTFFEKEKQKALAIKSEIDKTDKEIDQMVYKLYGLTEEEIKIVEGNG